MGLDLSQKQSFLVAGHVLTLRGPTDVSGGTSVGGPLWVLGESVLPCPVKVVCRVLGIATDLLILKVAGVICMQGVGGGVRQRVGLALPYHPQHSSQASKQEPRVSGSERPGNRAQDKSVPRTRFLCVIGPPDISGYHLRMVILE